MSDSDSSAGDSSADSSSERSANSTFSGNDDDDDNDSTVGSVSGSQQSGASSGGSHAKAEAGATTETGTSSKAAAATVKPFAIPKHRVCTKVARYPVVFKTFKHYKWKRVPREEGQWSLHWADKVLLCMSTPKPQQQWAIAQSVSHRSALCMCTGASID